jgi:hypothetical protein
MPTEQARNLIAYKRTRVTSVQGEHTHACKRKLKLKSENGDFPLLGIDLFSDKIEAKFTHHRDRQCALSTTAGCGNVDSI